MIQRLLGNIVFLINILLALVTLLAYQLAYSAGIGHWMAGFITLGVPFFFIANFIFFLFWLVVNPRKAWLSGLLVLLGVPLIGRTFHWDNQPVKVVPDNVRRFSVLSYNAMYCDAATYVDQHKRADALGIVAAIDTIRADIKCFQEFYNWNSLKDFRTIYKLTDTHPYYTYMHSTADNNEGQGHIGLAIFSRYPIIRKKETYWKLNNNGMLLADIVIDRDTLRVINVQFRSMGIRVQKVIQAQKDEEKAKAEARNILSQLKTGFEERRIQAEEALAWIEESPYPVILCGDFNEIPYGFAYGTVRKKLRNAFENAGRGFGFTYNKQPNFIRIDNEFYDDSRLTNYSFQTLDYLPYSDHYPIRGKYFFTPK